ncbi:MAG: glycosyltransferase family A protein [Schlesneria sp.]
MSASTSLVILTYVDSQRPIAVRQRLPDAIASLEQTSYRGPVMIVDDGSTCDQHIRFLDHLATSGRYDVIRRPVNGGISRAKNTCLRLLAECDADIGFLAEDDIIFHEGWDEAYVTAMHRSGIQHFSWYVHNPYDQLVACNGTLVSASSGLLGLLLTMTREVLAKVGGFKILPHRYGYEHIQWTYRNVLAGLAPFPCDIVESRRYIGRNVLPSSVDEIEVQIGTEVNRPSGYVIERLFEPFEE